MVKDIVSKMDYNITKMDYNNQLRRIFTGKAGALLLNSNLSKGNIKVETSNDAYYSNEYNKLSYRG